MKKTLSFTIITTLLLSNLAVVCSAEPLKGSVVETTEIQTTPDEIFTGKIETLQRKKIINHNANLLKTFHSGIVLPLFFAFLQKYKP